MAKVKVIEVRYQDEDNKDQTEKVQLNVNAEGSFYATVPDFIIDLFRSGYKVEQVDYRQTAINRPVQLFTNDHLHVLEGAIRDAFKVYSKPEESHELVLIYQVRAIYWWPCTDRDTAEFRPPHEGNHHSPVISNFEGHSWNRSSDAYRLSVSAGVFVKTTIKRGASTRYRYVPLIKDSHDLKDVDLSGFPEHAYRLNDWRGRCPEVESAGHGSSRSHSIDRKYTEIPYDREKAETLYELLKATANLGRVIDELFKDGNIPALEDGTLKLT